MKVIRGEDVDNPNEFFKITACRKCGKVTQVARESRTCGKCARKLVEGIFQSLSYWR